MNEGRLPTRTWPPRASSAPRGAARVTRRERLFSAAAERMYADLQAVGIEVLFDDREERAGVKFNDADLIGNPVRVSVSSRTLGKGEAEIKLRSAAEAVFVPLAEVVPAVRGMLDELYAGLTGDA